jgi:hypothetical protein
MLTATANGRALLEAARARRLTLLTERLRTLDADEVATIAAAADAIERAIRP